MAVAKRGADSPDIQAVFVVFADDAGIPQIYYGTEIGMEGGSDPDNRRDMRWEVFGGGAASGATFDRERDIFQYTQRLIKLRKDSEALRHGYLFTLYVDHFIYGYLREFQGDTLLVVLNNGVEDMPTALPIAIEANSNVPVRIKDYLRGKTWQNPLDSGDRIVWQDGGVRVKLRGKEGRIYQAI